jgi:hypothetical protein
MYSNQATMGDLGKFKLKKVGKFIKKAAKRVAPFIPATAGIAMTAGILKGRKAKKMRKAAAAAASLNVGSSGTAVEIASMARGAGTTPQVIAETASQSGMTPLQVAQMLASGSAPASFAATNDSSARMLEQEAGGAESPSKSNIVKYGLIGVAALGALYLASKRKR